MPDAEQPILITERLLMRRWTPGDLDALFAILSDPTTMRFWPAPFELDATRAWLERNIARYAEDGFGRAALVLRDTNTLIGDSGLVRAAVNGRPEVDLGYIIHHPFEGRGYATEAAAAWLRYASATLGIQRVVANMAYDHHGSARVAEKIGMHLEERFNNPRNRGLPTLLYAWNRE